MANQRKRRSLLINPSFQLKLVGYTLLLLLVTMMIFYISNLYFILRFIDIGQSLGLADTHPFFRFVVEQRRMMNSIFAITALIATTVASVGGLILSHRVAGALYRLHSHIDMVTETRELKDVSFRKGDFFSEVADSFNRMMASLRGAKRD